MKKAIALSDGFLSYLSADIELLLELFYTSACVNKLLLTCVERMALGADFNVDSFLNGTCFKDCATCTLDSCRAIVGMDTFSHYVHLFQRFVYINNYNLLQTTMIITYQKKDCKYFFEKNKEFLLRL